MQLFFMRNIAKIFFETLRQLTFRKLLKLFALAVSNPVFAVLSFIATVKAYQIAKKYFPDTNSNNGIGNAFRHALWVCLIMMYCCKISSAKKAEKWCVRMTSLHEELFPNKPLETKMDLHNNQVGLNYFLELLPTVHRQFFETSFFIDGLLDKTKTAKIIENLTDDGGRELVYLKT